MISPIKLLLATRNAGKLRELQEMLSDLPFDLTDLMAFPQIQEIAETGHTFAENAKLKAAGYSSQARLLALADDSGLEIDALAGAPGVLSARYLNDMASYPDRINSLLTRLAGIEQTNRTARFVCAIALADRDGKIVNLSMGICEGRIALVPRGTGGFGYDPIFIPDGYDLTFAQLDPAVKNQISHRARALRAMREYLEGLTIASRAD